MQGLFSGNYGLFFDASNSNWSENANGTFQCLADKRRSRTFLSPTNPYAKAPPQLRVAERRGRGKDSSNWSGARHKRIMRREPRNRRRTLGLRISNLPWFRQDIHLLRASERKDDIGFLKGQVKWSNVGIGPEPINAMMPSCVHPFRQPQAPLRDTLIPQPPVQ